MYLLNLIKILKNSKQKLIENQNIKLKPRLQKKRHIAKTITWRIIGSIDTWLISWILIQFFGENPQEASEAAYIYYWFRTH